MTLPHLLWESEPVSTRSEAIGAMVENVRLNIRERGAWEKRMSEQINFGDAALKEATRNLDFPPAAVFFLQAAHSYYLTALADCLEQSVMSLLTRPMAKVRRMSADTGVRLEEMVKANLHLEADPSPSLEGPGEGARRRERLGGTPSGPRPPRKDAWPLPLLRLPAGAGIQGGGRASPGRSGGLCERELLPPVLGVLPLAMPRRPRRGQAGEGDFVLRALQAIQGVRPGRVPPDTR